MRAVILLAALCAMLRLATFDASAVAGGAPRVQSADRQVAWVIVANSGTAEREMNAQSARGLRFAAATDGLPCSVAVMQTPRTASAAASYRLIADRDLAGALDDLGRDGFTPRGLVRAGARAHVVWERVAQTRETSTLSWRLVEFSSPETLEADLAEAVKAGYVPALLARQAFRSWPGLSTTGQLILGQRAGALPREVRVLRGTSRNVDALARDVAALSSEGWQLDVAFTSARDGSAAGRRERAWLIFTRDSGASRREALQLVRATSWGMVGAGEALAAAPYWNDFLFVFRPLPRRQTWATPLRLSAQEASCGGLAWKLRLDGQREQRSTIVGAIARPVQGADAFELVVVLDERLGG